jgi:hypothetical protein
MDLVCPPPAALASMPANSQCPFTFNQIIRLAVQRFQGPDNPFDATNPITKKASWTALTTAPDSKKLVFTPIFAGLVIPESEAKVEGGGDNSTPFGIEQYVGENPVKVAFKWRNLIPAIVNVLRTYVQESIPTIGVYALTVYMITKDGLIVAVELKNANVVQNAGIPVFNFRVSSTGSEGLNAPNTNSGGFSMPDNWDANIVMIKPEDFNPLTDF